MKFVTEIMNMKEGTGGKELGLLLYPWPFCWTEP